jgi:hypothetical protein
MDNDYNKELGIPDADDWMRIHTPDIAILGSIVAVGLFIMVYLLLTRKPKQKRKNINKRRKLNPTLAQTGGLPPPRDPNSPPTRPRL